MPPKKTVAPSLPVTATGAVIATAVLGDEVKKEEEGLQFDAYFVSSLIPR